jgi:hypothetical protein
MLAGRATLTLLTDRFIAVNAATRRCVPSAVAALSFSLLARFCVFPRLMGFPRRNIALREGTIDRSIQTALLLFRLASAVFTDAVTRENSPAWRS